MFHGTLLQLAALWMAFSETETRVPAQRLCRHDPCGREPWRNGCARAEKVTEAQTRQWHCLQCLPGGQALPCRSLFTQVISLCTSPLPEVVLESVPSHSLALSLRPPPQRSLPWPASLKIHSPCPLNAPISSSFPSWLWHNLSLLTYFCLTRLECLLHEDKKDFYDTHYSISKECLAINTVFLNGHLSAWINEISVKK